MTDAEYTELYRKCAICCVYQENPHNFCPTFCDRCVFSDNEIPIPRAEWFGPPGS